jgi:hypothetical protein
MLEPHDQTPEAVRASLEPLFPVIWRVMEHATQEARDYFEGRDEDRDAWLYPNLVRYHAKLGFDAEGHKVTDIEAQPGFARDDLANNGLLLTLDGFRVRILKSDRGELPVPGASLAKQAYYSQPSLFEDPREVLNLVVLWDAPGGVLGDLDLVCPKSGKTTRSSVGEHWAMPIPHPATSHSDPTPVEHSPDADDLPITLPGEEETGTDTPQ